MATEQHEPIADLLSLQGRVAVVTGAGRGVGAAIAGRLAEAGATVVIADLDIEMSERAVAELTARGLVATPALVDVRSTPSVAELADSAVRSFGSLDIWVNNAGIYPRHGALEMTDDDWDRVVETNLRGTFAGARASARAMVSGGRGGVIVNIASASAFRAPGLGLSHYVASKAGIVGLTKSLAVELGPSGIRVLAVAPILVPTENAVELLRRDGAPSAVAEAAARVPLRRVPEPDDIARAVLFATSGLARCMTGSTLLVDSGQLAG